MSIVGIKFINHKFPQTFKFKRFLPALVISVFFIFLWIFIAITVPMQGGGVGGVLFCLGMAALLSFPGWIFLKSRSDIVIDESAITRVILGKDLQSMAWADVQRITVFPIRAPGVSRNVTGYNIIALDSKGGGEKYTLMINIRI
ncbi:hypothetical protein [Xanthomonas albilineans]|uniref:hypothetical protein n=1 Tax=Xanthomonas albilineans TaxID=29447 RepID=UPI0012D46CBC|nr:hypothetical protein [Xanthomonas albilineans]